MEPLTPTPPVTAGAPASNPISWSGSFPQYYDTYLSFIFSPYAENLVNRIEVTGLQTVLELACGTGRVTQSLIDHVPASVQLLATDLSPDMMAIGQAKLQAPNLQWAQVDMTSIPYANDTFDLIVCQFGVMFAPDKARAFAEMYRVLKPGGRLLFNTWGPVANNHVFRLFNDVMVRRTGMNIGAAEQGPFSMPDEQAVLRLLETAGFRNRTVDSVALTGEATTAADAAKGFFQGNQVSVTLREKNPAIAQVILAEIENDFSITLGEIPMRTPLQAWVFEATK